MSTAYTNKILRIDLSSGKINTIPTGDYSEKFLGGRGIAAKIYWDEVPPRVGSFDPENRLFFMTGPLAGFPSVGGSRWQISAKSPFGLREHCVYSNLGGNWGARLKLAGYDGLVVQGKAEKPVYIAIDDGDVHIKDASFLWGKGNLETWTLLKGQTGNASILSIGPAGENLSTLAITLADTDASGSAGLGAVMGSKNLKAIAVKGNQRPIAGNEEQFNELVRYFNHLKNYPSTVPKGIAHSLPAEKLKKDYCFGCVIGCNRAIYQADDGKKGKFMCQAAQFYDYWSQKYCGKLTEIPFYATKMCDDFGVCTKALMMLIIWLTSCFKAGILNDNNTGMPLSKLGSLEYIETLIKKLSLREGFGDILARGAARAAQAVGQKAIALVPPTMGRQGDTSEYGPRLYLHSALIRATEPARVAQGALHEVGLLFFRWLAWLKKEGNAHITTDELRHIIIKFWGSEEAADFTTYEGKALAAKKIQDREYAKESMILCDALWPVYGLHSIREDKNEETLESRVLSAVLGKQVSEDELCLFGERIFNLQRAIFLREGHKGREDDTLPEFYLTVPLSSEKHNPDCLVPGKNGEVISRKGAVVDREKFEKMKDDYYRLRGWDVKTGIPLPEKMSKLGLVDIIESREDTGDRIQENCPPEAGAPCKIIRT